MVAVVRSLWKPVMHSITPCRFSRSPPSFGTIHSGITRFLLRYPLSISVSRQETGVKNMLVSKYAKTRCTAEARSLTLCVWWRSLTEVAQELPRKEGVMRYSTQNIVRLCAPYWLWINLGWIYIIKGGLSQRCRQIRVPVCVGFYVGMGKNQNVYKSAWYNLCTILCRNWKWEMCCLSL